MEQNRLDDTHSTESIPEKEIVLHPLEAPKMDDRKKKSKKSSRSDATTAESMGEDLMERRRKQQLRREKRLAKRLAALGLDENGDPLDNFSLLKYPVREWKFKFPLFQDPVAVNPIVTIIGVVCLWSIVLWNMALPASALKTILDLRSSVTTIFTWFFQGSKATIFVFLLFIWFKYGHIRMGGKDERPEYSTLSYFSMSFVAGAGSATMYYCVQEPMFHQSSHFYAQAGYRSQDEIDMFAINMTVSNWGIPCWIHYTLVAVCMSLAVHRFNLPLTFRSCFYPILGAYTWGWIGDFIDGLAIVVTIAGSCTYLGSSVMLIVTGFMHLGWIDETKSPEEITDIQKVVIWVVILVSTATVISGLRRGIHLTSLAAMGTGTALLGVVFFLEDAKFLLNLQVQEVGLFLQTGLFQLNFWTDAFGQLPEGSGRAVDGKAAEQWWMTSWTTFYVAWVVTCSIGVGVFTASISRGRRLGEIIVHGLITPVAYCLVWFCTWGGIGLRQSRLGKELDALGAKLFNNSRHFLADGSDFCYDVPQVDVLADDEVIFTNLLPGVTPVCQFDADNPNTAVFNVFHSFGFAETFGRSGLGPGLSLLFIVGIACFFVGSSDAATLVVDSLASNGRKNYHWTRRLYWASTAGALTTAMLSSGGTDSLNAIQAASIICGLPVAILLCYFIQSVTLFCEAAAEDGDTVQDYKFPAQPEFSMPVYGGVFNAMEYLVSFGNVNTARIEAGMDRATRAQAVEFAKGLIVPFVPLNKILSSSYPQNPKTNATVVVLYSSCYLGWVSLFLASSSWQGLHGLSLTLFFICGFVLGTVRLGFRRLHNLRSNVVADITTGLFMWPQVLAQMHLQGFTQLKTSKEKKKRSEAEETA